MAAPSKEGLDYFPFDVDLLADRKLRRAKLKYGYLAPMVYIVLLSILYKDKGYYIDYSDNNKDDVIWDILNLLQGKYQPTAEAVAEIIEELVACELFSGDQFNSKTITSIRAQRTYYRSTVDRKAVDIDFDKWLLSESEMKALSEKSMILHNFINRPINGVNHPINRVNRPINSQSKVKESKVNITTPLPPSQGEQIPRKSSAAKDRKQELEEVWNKNKGDYSPALTRAIFDWVEYKKKDRGKAYKPKGFQALLSQIKKNADEYGETEMIEVIQESIANGYQGIVWDRLMKRQKNQQQSSSYGQPKQNRFVNYEQRDWDFADLEKLERERVKRQLAELNVDTNCQAGNKSV